MEWREETLIPTHIEVLWNVFQDANISDILPSVETHELVEGKPDSEGARHRQTYRCGRKVSTHIVETFKYIDEPSYKEKEIAFQLQDAYQIRLRFQLRKLNENETMFIYEGEYEAVNFVARIKHKFVEKDTERRMVQRFVQRVREETGA
ncbi:SRPBCC family protein [Alkalicoccus chagannorensis]|uniref:SRPBCC family protein n=1 Tax=Alkalicoccus chagannorensis TaxID=427072 RepID=UPI0003F92FE3|nr:SRPBCC family protein [Alkalicoccus chagannorensis]